MPCQQRWNPRFSWESGTSRARDDLGSSVERRVVPHGRAAAVVVGALAVCAISPRTPGAAALDASAPGSTPSPDGTASVASADGGDATREVGTRASAVDGERGALPLGPLRLEPPPTPAQRPSVLGWELHVLMVLPLADALCPAGEACLLNEGVGLGGSVERRWPFGGALVLGYDLALLEGGGIFEVGTLQVLRAGVKWVVPIDRATKPYVGVDVGAVLFGDSFEIATAGGAVQLDAGAEIELTHRYALKLGLVFRAFTTGGFVSIGDSVARGRDPSASLALVLQVGLAFLEDPTERT
jgi:hypothetical protein